MFEKVDPELDFPKIEHRILKFWDEVKAFEKLREKNRGGERFSFLDGPITANNPMMVHHAWGRTYKDIYQRYRAMCGYDQRFQNGFDCQGLWVEVEVEKELGFKSKRDIERYGVAEFVEKCKERALRFSKVQTQQSIRLGYWMDWENSYYTMSDENNYTIWHFLKRCHEHGWIYKGHDVMPWCPRCSTAISEHEIATEGYKELSHRSVYVRFPIEGRDREYLLVWTTTPWTLTSNVAAAVHPELTYVRVRQNGDIYYLSEGALHVLEGPYEVTGSFKGKELVGLRYRGPFDELPAQEGVEHRVIPWKEKSEREGTGIVHIAPGCGKEDFALGREHGLAVIAPLDEFGDYTEGFDWLTGRNASEVADPITENLREKGLLYRDEMYTHRYPVCWRCDTELIFRLVDEWFISMDELRYRIMEVAKKVNWIPDFGLERELDWLRNMHDWCISKKRYWGLALPIYECECGHFDVIGGEVELRRRAIEGWEKFEGHSPHRPWIDAVKIGCPECGRPVPRIPDVGNPWLDAGIVPYSTLNYRHDRSYWEKWFPADFSTECFPGQFRNWFYSILAMSTVLENSEPVRTILGHALVVDEHGEEMHKSKGNAISFDEAAERMGAEAMRWIYARQNPALNLAFGYGPAAEVKRRLLTLWNTYSFFVTYANLDRINPREIDIPPGERSLMDRWLLSKLNVLTALARRELDRYNVASLVRGAEDFLEDLSNWYVRRCRRRFWKSENDSDKAGAYLTLYETLVSLIKVLAPVIPFLTEEIYQNLVRSVDPGAPESIHLCDYPEPDEGLIDRELMEHMDAVMRVVSLGRAARNSARMKVRQPLPVILVAPRDGVEREGLERLKGELLDELNIKEMKFVESPRELVTYSLKPNFKVLGPRYGKLVKRIAEALEGVPEEIAFSARMGEPFDLELDGQVIHMEPDEVMVEVRPREGLAVAEDKGSVVAIGTELTEELVNEGLAREFIHKVQNLRKEAGFEISDRIEMSYEASPRLRRAIEAFEGYIKGETLCLKMSEGLSPGDWDGTLNIDGEKAQVVLRRVVLSGLQGSEDHSKEGG